MIEKLLPQTEPPLLFQRNLLGNSVEAEDWKLASGQWTPIFWLEVDQKWDSPPSGVIADFVSKCDLCGNRLERYNFIIQNVHTARELTVGSRCAKRFPILHDVTENVSTYLDRFAAAWRHGPAIRTLAVAFRISPIDRKSFHEFCKLIKQAVGPISTLSQWEAKKGEALKLCNVSENSLQALKIQYAFLDPSQLKFSPRERIQPRDKSPEEISREIWRRKRTLRVDLHGTGRSALYRQNRLDPGQNDD